MRAILLAFVSAIALSIFTTAQAKDCDLSDSVLSAVHYDRNVIVSLAHEMKEPANSLDASASKEVRKRLRGILQRLEKKTARQGYEEKRGPSFDCSKAATEVEKTICGDAELSKLDESLNKAYQKALKRTDIKKEVIESQRQWLKSERNVCRNAECMRNAYETRIKELGLSSSFGIVFLRPPDQSTPPPKAEPKVAKSLVINEPDKPIQTENEQQNEAPAGTESCAEKVDFTGTWVIDLRPKSQLNAECGHAYFTLIQKGDRLCGDHTFATPDCGRLNEGYPGSVKGFIVGSTAVLSVTSGRNGAIVMGKATRKGNTLLWTTVEHIKPGEPMGDSPLILGRGILKLVESPYTSQKLADECTD